MSSRKISKGVLYISYDGMLEPLGKSQVLGYLKLLAKNRRIVLVSFEKPSDLDNEADRNRVATAIAEAGIIWHPLRYHKKPSAVATMWDIAAGTVVSFWLVFRYQLHIVHARSYVPSVMALVLKRLTGVKYIFDMRGFWADERVDGGLWRKEGQLYLTAKWFERQFLLSADVVVSLTQAAVDEIRRFPYLKDRMPPFEIITTCADLELFRPDFDELLLHSVDTSFTLGYVGSVGVWYLFDETLRCFEMLRERLPGARMCILNRGGHDFIYQRLKALHIESDDVHIQEADHQGVALAMQQMDAGIFFYKPSFSRMATAPTRLGEFLGCGIPCLGNTGVGDMQIIFEKEHVGVMLHDFTEESMREAIDRLVKLASEKGIRQRCRNVAIKYFSLEIGVETYQNIYMRLSS